MKSTPLIRRMEMSRLKTDDGVFPGNQGALLNGEHEKHGAHEQLVGDGIKVLAENGLLMQGAGEEAVEAVAESGENEQRECPFEIVLDQIDHDEGQKIMRSNVSWLGAVRICRRFTGAFLRLNFARLNGFCIARVILIRGRKEFADQKWSRIHVRFFCAKRWASDEDAALGQIEFQPLQAVHGKERRRLPRRAHRSRIWVMGNRQKRIKIDAAQAEADRPEG